VLLAAVVEVDGVWRTTRDVIVLSPTEGDALAALTEDLLEVTVHGAGDGRVPPDVARGAAEPPPFDRAPEYGVMARHEPPSPPEVRRVTSDVVAFALPRLVGELVEHRAAVGLANADGDAMPASAGAPGPQPPRAHEEWMRAWVDTPSQLLGGRTPRRAASDERWVVRLETLLRSFEWEAERAAQDFGGEPLDHTWLRQELELPPYALL
jgi:hypothetical protein